MDDEVLARGAALVGVALAREHERALDELAVDLRPGVGDVLLDDREEVAQQDALVVGEPGGRADRGRGRAAAGLVDLAVLEARLGHGGGAAAVSPPPR